MMISEELERYILANFRVCKVPIYINPTFLQRLFGAKKELIAYRYINRFKLIINLWRVGPEKFNRLNNEISSWCCKIDPSKDRSVYKADIGNIKGVWPVMFERIEDEPRIEVKFSYDAVEKI